MPLPHLQASHRRRNLECSRTSSDGVHRSNAVMPIGSSKRETIEGTLVVELPQNVPKPHESGGALWGNP